MRALRRRERPSRTRAQQGGEGPAAANERFVVTGGTGFLGADLCRLLVQDGRQVAVLARGSQTDKEPADALPKGVQRVVGSILDQSALERAFTGADGVFHLAGLVEHSRRRAGQVDKVHVDGTLAVLRACKATHVRRVVYASTSGVVAVSPTPDSLASDDAPYAMSVVEEWPYYASKVRAEQAALREAEALGVELVIMRPTLLLGPGDWRLSSTRVIADLLAGRVPLLPSGGLSAVDVRDTAAAFVAAMQRGQPGRTYLLSAGNMTLEEFFALVGETAGVSTPKLRVPNVVALGGARLLNTVLGVFGVWDPSLDPVVVEMSQHFWYISADRAQQELGFAPRPIADSIRDTVAWLRRRQSA